MVALVIPILRIGGSNPGSAGGLALVVKGEGSESWRAMVEVSSNGGEWNDYNCKVQCVHAFY